MDLTGIEPVTSSLRTKRATNCATGPQDPEIITATEAWWPTGAAPGEDGAELNSPPAAENLIDVELLKPFGGSFFARFDLRDNR